MSSHARHAKPAQRHAPKPMSVEEMTKKRARGEISCAECKRLKLKCDKKLPCGSCVRRGCSNICPQGSLTTGQGSRFILQDTAQLHQKISEMSHRIQQLEDALAAFQAGISTETHPLLVDGLLAIKGGPELRQPDDAEPPEDPLAETMDAFGTLAIGERGESRYFGSSAGSETLLMAGAELDTEPTAEEGPPPVMPDILKGLTSSFPMGVGCASNSQLFEDAMDTLFACLPPTTRAWSLFETYMENASWVFRPVGREHLIEDILTPIYTAKKEREDPESAADAETEISPHKLAVLYFIFAQGAISDFTLPPYNTEGEQFYHYALAALSLRSVFDSPVLETVQAVLLMGHYHSSAGEKYSRDSVWTLMSLGAKIAQSVSLWPTSMSALLFLVELIIAEPRWDCVHRDPARWNMDEKTANRRRRLFWEIYATDMFFSLALGRPPCVELTYVDCAFPKDQPGSEAQFWNWKYQYSKDVFEVIIKHTLAADPPSYQTILALDRKVREKILPPGFHVLRPRDELITNVSSSAYLQAGLLSQLRTVTMLYLHRSFFAQALLDHPNNPLLSRYAPSFLAASSCASSIIRIAVIQFEKVPELCLRWWTLWTHLLSAGIIVGSIATRAPSSTMAPDAFRDLGTAIDLFAKGAEHSVRARRAMAILTKLKDNATVSLAEVRSGSLAQSSPTPSTPSQVFHNQELGGPMDELALFGGQTRVLFSKLFSANRDRTKSQAGAVAGSSPHPPEPEDVYMGMQNVHPSLMKYISSLPATTFSGGFSGRPDGALTQSASNSNCLSPLAQSAPESPIPGLDIYGQPCCPGLPAQRDPHQAPTSTSTSTSAADVTYDPTLFGPFEHFYRQAAATSGTSAGAPSDSDVWEMKDINVELKAEGGAMDDRWMTLVNWSGAVPGY
ncbi:hypothetical protein FIBSPDRAFT_838684 [Athelia psychrophila]|uniref:Zn(2)-C6 fungal-type domain-containing protein n=1 Tax=Athelia psychrophila TaxID=1759441 RepID=A0A165Z5P5_9AGAM|nr:hypothetical protein FIBSPDRAFT_838684 [Fibularhizoctonia sp. CBS 109695]